MSNPYESPHVEPGISPKRFRLRTVPVGLLGGFGLLMAFMGVFLAIAAFFDLVTGRPMYTPGPTFSAGACLASISSVILGLILLLAARLWWIGKWKTSLAIIVAVIGLSQLASAVGIVPE